jgi:hypothetical protein
VLVALTYVHMVGQLIPRVGFKAKVKEWNDFKNAIEIYESDPEMNPINELQVPLPPSLCSTAHTMYVRMPRRLSCKNKYKNKCPETARTWILW